MDRPVDRQHRLAKIVSVADRRWSAESPVSRTPRAVHIDLCGWCRFAEAAPFILGDVFAVTAGFTLTVMTAD
jgi:hypothetical protein